jgi:cell division protein FtsQ
MKKRSVIKRPAVKRNKTLSPHESGRLIRFLYSFSFKVTLGLAAFVAVSFFFIFVYQSLLSSSYVKLETVIIKGVDEKIKNELLEMSQLSSDMSLLAININELKQRLEEHPWIRAIEVEKRFPHTLIIRGEKEVPQAIVALDTLSYINRWGTIFKTLGPEDNVDYPVITGISRNENEMVRQLQLAANVLETLESETGSWAPANLSEMHVSTTGNVSLYSASLPFAIKMRGSDFDSKKDQLKKIVEHLKKTGLIHTVSVINLNYQNGVVVSFKKG